MLVYCYDVCCGGLRCGVSYVLGLVCWIVFLVDLIVWCNSVG